MLGHCFTGSESAGDCRRAALCYREERIYDTLTGYQRTLRRQSAVDGTRDTDRPALAEGQLVVFPLLVPEGNNSIVYLIFSVGLDIDNFAFKSGRSHEFVLDDGSLGAFAVDVAALELIAGLDEHIDLPLALLVERALGAAL